MIVLCFYRLKMKIISIIVSVNLVLFFISVYSNDFYINSFPQINGFFLKLKQSENVQVINDFKIQEAGTVRDICRNVMIAPVFRPAKDTSLIVNFPNNEPNTELFKLETIFLIYPVSSISINVDVFLCKITRTGRMYISSDFRTYERYFIYYIPSSLNLSWSRIMLGLAQRRVAQVSVIAHDVFYGNEVNENQVIDYESHLHFWLKVYQDQAFRLCSLAFTNIFPDHIQSNIRYFTVVNQLVLGSNNVIILYAHTPQFVNFPVSLSCEIRQKDKFWIFHIIPHRIEQSSFYIVTPLQEHVYILEKQLTNIFLFSEGERELLCTNDLKLRSEDGFLLMT